MPDTATSLERPPLDRTTVERFGVEHHEPAWLRDERRAALERYDALAWPKNDVGEEWRRFPLKEIPLAALHPLESRNGARRVAVAQERGVVVASLEAAASEHADLLRPYLSQDGGVASHAAIRAYAHAAWSTGTFVSIPPEAILARPIEVATGPGISRTVVVAGRSSRATVVEELTSDDDAHVAIPLLDVHLEDGAALDYVRIERFGARTWDLGAQWYRSRRDSRLASFNVIVGAYRAKVGIGSDIVEDGAVVKLYGLVAAGSDQKIDLNTLQDLFGSHSESVLLYLAALYEEAKAVTYGVIRVEPQSRATSSYQECRNMLLSEHAGAVPIPVLEILTNDVLRCGHGATAGAIDESELFYVMSRGLPRRDAERLLVRGFFERVVANIGDTGLRRRVLDALAPRIGRIAELDA